MKKFLHAHTTPYVSCQYMGGHSISVLIMQSLGKTIHTNLGSHVADYLCVADETYTNEEQ